MRSGKIELQDVEVEGDELRRASAVPSSTSWPPYAEHGDEADRGQEVEERV